MQKKFRLGATSYVFETDLVGNAQRLAGIVDDMELVLFESETHGTNFPDADTVARLNELAAKHQLTYTAHLPHDVNLNHALWRARNERAIAATRALKPFAYIVHLDGRALMQNASAENSARWQTDAARALSEIIAQVGDAARVCVENVEAWNPDYFADLVEQSNAARCIDVGHLWLNQRDPLRELQTHLPRTRVIHLHGVAARDHVSLTHTPFEQLQRVMDYLQEKNFDGVATLEVFGESDFFTSRAAALRASRLA